MGRLVDWPERLAAHIEDWRYKKFEWGKADCALFCFNAEIAMCGQSRFEDFSGQYKTPTGSLKALIKFGKGDLDKSVSEKLQAVDISKAQRGDVALIDTDQGDALSLVIGNKLAAMGHDGLVFLPITAAKKAWRI